MKIRSADLKGKVPPVGAFSLLRAEWQDINSSFVLVRYAIGDREQDLGVRLDLDKRIFLDHLEDPALEKALETAVPTIRTAVAKERERIRSSPRH